MNIQDMNNRYGRTFIRVAKENRIREFYEHGVMVFNPLSYFKKLEDGQLRGDPNEGLFKLLQAKDSVIKIRVDQTGEEFILDKDNGLVNQIKMELNETINTGIFCMSICWFSNDRYMIIDQLRNMGTHALIINKPHQFLDMVEKYAKKNGIKMMHGAVTYVPEKEYHGNMGVFRKLDEHRSQNEYRFIIPKLEKPYKIEIGSLSNISKIVNVKEVFNVELK
jgi:SNF2 family DNA or RNA helicase